MDIPVPTKLTPLQVILPQEPLLMMGAGPVPIPHRVAHANSIVINHLGDVMAQVIEQVKAMGAYVFQTRSEHVLGVAGPGSAAMEMAIANLVEPGDSVLAVCNGYFSRRMAEMAERVGGQVKIIEVPNNQGATLEMVDSYLRTGHYKALTIVQGETSNTVHNLDLQQISKLAHSPWADRKSNRMRKNMAQVLGITGLPTGVECALVKSQSPEICRLSHSWAVQGAACRPAAVNSLFSPYQLTR